VVLVLGLALAKLGPARIAIPKKSAADDVMWAIAK
jgi:hypothetical protein